MKNVVRQKIFKARVCMNKIMGTVFGLIAGCYGAHVQAGGLMVSVPGRVTMPYDDAVLFDQVYVRATELVKNWQPEYAVELDACIAKFSSHGQKVALAQTMAEHWQKEHAARFDALIQRTCVWSQIQILALALMYNWRPEHYERLKSLLNNLYRYDLENSDKTIANLSEKALLLNNKEIDRAFLEHNVEKEIILAERRSNGQLTR